ncbi:MAG TPA: ribosome biogenesis GTPase Der [Candidatus Komeilibacteria bacterium]|nr:ribosome biogenesis GTPase Der [Candidatus Komeilibacteria bacterium]
MQPMNHLPKIALIGRANVGKSTLFNTLAEQKKAIVSSIAGTTRDRNYAKINWRGRILEIIDTGGIDIVHPSDIEQDILAQAQVAKKQANLILFLVDAKTGPMPQDKTVAQIVRLSQKPTILVVNKADSKRLKESVAEFYRLNLGEPRPISALNGTGTGDLLDEVIVKLGLDRDLEKTQANGRSNKTAEKDPSPVEEVKDIHVAIIGKPNTGKSTLVNAILGEKRMITSPLPYTTRDAQNIELRYQNQNFILIDTAGVRKKAKIKDRLEKFSVAQSIVGFKNADVALLMTDASAPLGKQDKTLAGEIQNCRTSLIIVANKWDKVNNKNEKTINKFIEYYQYIFPYLSYAPIIFISALEKQRTQKVLDLIKEVFAERQRQITENALDKFLKYIIKKHPPSRGKGTKHPHLYRLKQIGVEPPTFELVKDPNSSLQDSYLRFIEKQLRLKFGFLGTPIVIQVRRLKG